MIWKKSLKHKNINRKTEYKVNLCNKIRYIFQRKELSETDEHKQLTTADQARSNTIKMSILYTKRFSFQTQFTISEVPFQLQMSSDKVEEDDMIMGRQVITLRTEERGVNIISEFSLSWERLMDN